MVENGEAVRKVLVFFLQQNLNQRRQQIPTHTPDYVLENKGQRSVMCAKCSATYEQNDMLQDRSGSALSIVLDFYRPGQY